jgi:riboflavin-specific deaminase-like protein
MVGIGTVLKDDPMLTVRHVSGHDPLRIIVDSSLRIPLTARVLTEGSAHRTIIATTSRADPHRARKLERLGAEVLVVPTDDTCERVSLEELLLSLGRRHLGSVLVEGGAGIITSLLHSRVVDRLVITLAPKIIGCGIEAVGDLSISRLDDALTFSSTKIYRLGPDMIFDGFMVRREGSG